MQATGAFTVKLTPQPAAVDAAPDSTRGRMTIEKQFHGALEAESRGEMLTGGDPKTGSAGYVAIERVSGTLDGKQGSFLLQHSATMHAGMFSLSITVIPGSGTDQLLGLDGKMAIEISGRDHKYVFDYSLPE